MVAATAPRERRETVKSTVSSRLMMKMASRVRPMLRSMSLTMMLIIRYRRVERSVVEPSHTKTLPSISWGNDYWGRFGSEHLILNKGVYLVHQRYALCSALQWCGEWGT